MYTSCPRKQLPMKGAGRHVESSRVDQQITALLLVQGGELGETDVEANTHSNGAFA